MAKKRKHSGPVQSAPKSFDENDAKIGPIRTYEDVADSEDEFHINRDKILLDEGPDAKRRRKQEEADAFLEQSDEEVLGYDDTTSEEEGDDEEHATSAKNAKRSAKAKYSDDEEAEDQENEEEEEDEAWGTSRKDYYNADMIETEADALEEEAEAKRLQQKKLQKLSEADFGFDENEWLDTGKGDGEGDIVTEVLKDIEITPEMGPEERSQLLKTRYPEFEFLANEYLQLQPLLKDIETEAASIAAASYSRDAPNIALMKSRALAAYIGALTMYFAVLTSTVRDGKASTALDPVELRDHTVMESLLQCRELWAKVKHMKSIVHTQVEEQESSEVEVSEANENLDVLETTVAAPTKSRKQRFLEAAAAKAAEARAERIRAAEEDLADLDDLIPKAIKKHSKGVVVAKPTVAADDDSDFGEEESLSARAVAEKAQRKKSLRFYTSQIAQKANRRADAGRDAGGDADLPHRERLRDRQARLNAEAEKRGQALDKYGRGTALGGDNSSGDEGEAAATATHARDEEDEYYDLVAQTSSKRKADKADKYAAIAAAKAAGSTVRITEGEVGEDGKRGIDRKILKNRGLAPKRSKDVRNPRVKKRHKYEQKLKKLNSIRAVYKGGEGKGGYGGELTGIKTGLVKSVKL